MDRGEPVVGALVRFGRHNDVRQRTTSTGHHADLDVGPSNVNADKELLNGLRPILRRERNSGHESPLRITCCNGVLATTH